MPAGGTTQPETSRERKRPVPSVTRYPIPNSSTCSSGVPQRRQIIAEQSPQTNGSGTAMWQRGQYKSMCGLRSSSAITVTLAAETAARDISPRRNLFAAQLFLVSCSNPTKRDPSHRRSLRRTRHAAAAAGADTESRHLSHSQARRQTEILEYKHRFVKVRTAQGAEGWTDIRQLLTPEQMAALRRMAESAAQYPSQGAATVFESLNMHTEPNRTSPSFWQIPENGKVDVIGHKLAPRAQAAPAAAPVPYQQPRTPRRRSKDKSAQSKIGSASVAARPEAAGQLVGSLGSQEKTARRIQTEAPKAEQKPRRQARWTTGVWCAPRTAKWAGC